MPQHRYGWTGPGLPSRQFPGMRVAAYPKLPAKFNLVPTGYFPPIWDQGDTSSCTGHGTTRAIMYARAKAGLPFIDLSRLFPYYNGRVVEGDAKQDCGASIGDVIAASLKFGDCPYDMLPTDPALVTVRPSSGAFASAIQHKSLAATRVMGNGGVGLEYHTKHCISQGGVPVVLGITLYESFEDKAVASNGVVPMPGPGEKVLGGHCVTACGYDDDAQRLLCANSWSKDWGADGYFQIPYGYVFDAAYSDDFHAIPSAA